MEHLYLVCYDISHQRRWRRLFKTMHGYGEWLQLSVFQCRLNKIRLIQMEAAISDIVHHREDHVMIIDLGPADKVQPRVRSIGKPFDPITRSAVIV
ncbi:MAG: CRISPR-associated endonuclease Cas2 [Deltaproteobacteria bacterium]|nr:CRISPR-associated endonuclease Cas2 [Deltaproteobacteria bacterium]